MIAPGIGGTLRFVLGDQLSPGLASQRDINPETDVVLGAEVVGECTYGRQHVKKVVSVLSAMRHFAEALRATGIRIDYRHLADTGNTGAINAA
ncbi:MAG: cryptochrome/photolyase family protein [Defluviicoccus sp.]